MLFRSGPIWTWDEDAYGLAQYQGEIKLTSEEIKDAEIEKDAKKYNL